MSSVGPFWDYMEGQPLFLSRTFFLHLYICFEHEAWMEIMNSSSELGFFHHFAAADLEGFFLTYLAWKEEAVETVNIALRQSLVSQDVDLFRFLQTRKLGGNSLKKDFGLSDVPLTSMNLDFEVRAAPQVNELYLKYRKGISRWKYLRWRALKRQKPSGLHAMLFLQTRNARSK